MIQLAHSISNAVQEEALLCKERQIKTAMLNGRDKSANHYESKNLQYNTLVCWFAGTNDLTTKGLMFQVLFFAKSLQFICYFFYKFTKTKKF